MESSWKRTTVGVGNAPPDDPFSWAGIKLYSELVHHQCGEWPLMSTNEINFWRPSYGPFFNYFPMRKYGVISSKILT